MENKDRKLTDAGVHKDEKQRQVYDLYILHPKEWSRLDAP